MIALLYICGGIVIGYVLARAVDAGRQLGQPGELVRRVTRDDSP